MVKYCTLIFMLFASLLPLQAQLGGGYSGPSVLSRGAGPGSQGSGDLVNIRPFARVEGLYDSGLFNVALDEEGEAQPVDAYGVQAGLGVYGYHTWRRTILGLNYNGNYRHYTQNQFFNGSDHILTLGVSHQMNRNWAFSVRQLAGTFTRLFDIPDMHGFVDQRFGHVPVNEIFDNRTNFLSTMADATYQPTLRLSFNIGGDGFLQRRRSAALIGMNGARARGDVAYRISRHQTLGVNYSYNHWNFTGFFGDFHIHGLGLNYGIRLNRNWEAGVMLGAFRIESQMLRRVELDPVVASILGTSFGTEATHTRSYAPSVQFQLTRTGRRNQFSSGYMRGVNPGNGVFLASRIESGNVGMNFAATRDWSLNVSGNYDKFSPINQPGLGIFQGYGWAAGANRRLKGALHLTLNTSMRRLQTSGGNEFDRNWFRGQVGLSFSPGDLPLNFW